MDTNISFFRAALTSVALALITNFVSGCAVTAPETRKAIASDLGEVTRNAVFIGDRIHYRIYYANDSGRTADILITDPLDSALSDVRMHNGGQYDRSTHTAWWFFENVADGSGGQVAFDAEVRAGMSITDQATITTGSNLESLVRDGGLSVNPRKEPVAPPIGLGLPKPKVQQISTNRVETRVCEPPRLGWVPFDRGAAEGSMPQAVMKDETTMGTLVRFDIPGMYVREAKQDDMSFHRLSIPRHTTRHDIGRPELPVVGQVIEIPRDVDFDIEIHESRSVNLGCYNVYPAQWPQTWNDWEDLPFSLDATAYTSDAMRPGELATVEAGDIGIMRGHRLVFLKVNPVQYNPVTQETVAYREIEVRLKFREPAQIMPVEPRILSPAFEDLLAHAALNHHSPDRYSWSNGDGDDKIGADYLILTHGSLYSAGDPNDPLNELADWKRQKGLKTLIEDVANVPGGPTAANIRDYIQTAYETWSPPPTYVLLVGDAELLPTHYETAHSGHNNTDIGTDLYYATVDGADPSEGGSDYFPDLYIGRLPMDTSGEVQAAVNKILDYEKNPPNNPAFYEDTALVRLFEDDTDSATDGCPEDGTEDCGFGIIQFAELTQPFLDAEGYDPERIYDSSAAATAPQSYVDGTALPGALLPASGFGWTGGTADIRTAINNGNFLVTYAGHGNRTSWSGPRFTDVNVNNLTNAGLTPVVLSYACQTGWFDTETDAADLSSDPGIQSSGPAVVSLGEAFIRAPNAGAVAFVGATRNSWYENNYLTLGAIKALWPDFDPTPPGYGSPSGLAAGPLVRMGQVDTFSKVYMTNFYAAGTDRQQMFEMYHLFGDPEMPVWTEEPERFAVVHPPGLGATGEQDFVVKVTGQASGDAVQNARVVLTRDTQILASNATDAGGFARFTLSGIGAGDVDLTVTAHNYRPYEATMAARSGGGQINRLDPEHGIVGQGILVGGRDYSGTEQVAITLDTTAMTTASASTGQFGQPGDDLTVTIPAGQPLGPANVVALGNDSGRYGVDVLRIRTARMVDVYTYDQWNEDTWTLNPGDNPVWDNPEIQLYDAASGDAVASNNLTVGDTYTVKARVHNDADVQADNVQVSFKWANYGVGQEEREWNLFDTDTIDVPRNGSAEAEVRWSPAITGHLCLLAEIYHIEDTDETDNLGQENTHVGAASSPAKVRFMVGNPTRRPAYVYLELRQLGDEGQAPRFWGTWIEHPDPQLLAPGESRPAYVIVDPDVADAEKGDQARFSLTGYIEGRTVGGVNFTVRKE